MSSRILESQFQSLTLQGDRDETWIMPIGQATEYEQLSQTIWMSESKIDLAGYDLQDLTVFFRNSFEQRGYSTTAYWQVATGESITANQMLLIEQVIISSVPLSNDNIVAYTQASPGFNQGQVGVLYDYGNFNREHIIHGHVRMWGLNRQTSDSFDEMGWSVLTTLDSNYYSSLEPTAADALYCYRIIKTVGAGVAYDDDPATATTGPYQFSIPAIRVLMPMTPDKEPKLEYMMRLKRSYELANQV